MLHKTRLLLLFPLAASLTIGACAAPDDSDTGMGGASGDMGSGGMTGTAGTGMTTGGAGTTGAAGMTGIAGTTGGAGTTGAAGTTGTAGRGGTTGAAGTTGGSGTTGAAGTTGMAGRGGTTGAAGTTGVGGRGGTTGVAGTTGTAGRGGTTGAAGTGMAGTTGSGGALAPCVFASGLNAAWVSFANDVPNPSMSGFQTMFRNVYMAGGRIVRWWFHTNGTVTPGYNASGMANPLSASAMTGLTNLLSWANAAGVKLVISLWSFDMLQGGQNITTTLRNNNRNLLTVDANRQAYIDNVLTPMVTALRGNPGLYAWEIFNEPEGMTTEHGWTGEQGGMEVPRANIYRTINWLAAAIHTADPSARVTSGAWTFQVSSTRNFNNGGHFYSNTSLVNAGGRANGTMDFYEVHYYMINGNQYSPFIDGRTPSYWGLTDKKVVMGEFYAQVTDGIQIPNLFTRLWDSGYGGAWAWQYTDSDAAVRWPTMQAPMMAVYNAHMNEVGNCR